MVFSSLVFLCVFLPTTLVLHTLLPARLTGIRNLLLILASLLFYAYGEPVYVFLMIGCALLNYVFALWIDGADKPLRRGVLLFLAVALDLSILCVFKYSSMLAQTYNTLFSLRTGWAMPDLRLPLPIGISFYTFQAISYVTDVYRKRFAADKSLLHVFLYLTFFPQLIAGPILRFTDMSSVMENRQVTQTALASGLRRFIAGLSKKVLIANTLASLVDHVYALETKELSLQIAWVAAFAYAVQLYFDFSGYSDMAIGMGRMFGFSFPENFRYPLAAKSMTDFWRRWHMTLTGWFRDYLYIPLGGNRKGRMRTWRNRFLVFFFTGLWHGADWTFVLWGLLHGAVTSLESILPSRIKVPRLLKHLYVISVFATSFVLFRAGNMAQAVSMYRAMFMPVPLDAARMAALSAVHRTSYLAAGVAALLFAFPTARFALNLPKRGFGKTLVRDASYLLSLLLLLLCLLRLSGDAYNPFIYFRF